MKWLLVSCVLVALAGLSGCAEKTAEGGKCQRRSDCADGLTCAHDFTCQTYARAKEMQVSSDKQ